MKNKVFKIIGIALVVMLAFTLSVSVGGAKEKPKQPVVGISTGSSGTSWRNIMIAALEQV